MIPPSTNLLTRTRKQSIEQLFFSRSILLNGIPLLAVIVLTGIFLTISITITQQETKRIQRDIAAVDQDTTKRQGGIGPEQIRQFNALLKRYSTVQQQSFVQWSSIVADLASTLPAGVSLTSVSMKPATLSIEIHGVAKTRSDLTDMQSALTTSTRFHDPSTPTFDFLLREDIPFQMTVAMTLP